MKSLFIQIILPCLFAFISVALGISETVFVWLAIAASTICVFFLATYLICYFRLQQEIDPVGRAVWPILVTDEGLLSRFNTFSATSFMLIVSLSFSAPIMFGAFFGAAAIASLYLFTEYAAEKYGPILEKVQDKYGDDMYNDEL